MTKTALFSAAYHNHVQIVEEMLQFKPNEAIVDKNNQTAYDRGNDWHQFSLFEILISTIPAIEIGSFGTARLIHNYLNHFENKGRIHFWWSNWSIYY